MNGESCRWSPSGEPRAGNHTHAVLFSFQERVYEGKGVIPSVKLHLDWREIGLPVFNGPLPILRNRREA